MYSGYQNQGNYTIAIGYQSGYNNQKESAVAIGVNSGYSNQDLYAVAVGYQCGQTNQGQYSVAVGAYAGSSAQASFSVAIGSTAGNNQQASECVAIGHSAGQQFQKNYSIAIGTSAGFTNQGAYSICIGANAGVTNNAASSIVLNAQNNTTLNASQASLYVAPISNAAGVSAASAYYTLQYQPSTSLVTLSNAHPYIQVGGNQNANVTVTAGSIIPLNYLYKSYGIGSEWNTSTYRWTVGTAGMYMLVGNLFCNGNTSGGNSRLYFTRNTNILQYSGVVPSGANDYLCACSPFVDYFSAGEVVDFRTTNTVTAFMAFSNHTMVQITML